MTATESQMRDVAESGARAAARSNESAGTIAQTITFQVWRGDGTAGHFEEYRTAVSDGMVVLDAIHQIQSESANDLAVRWNCKAGKCGSCSAEINGMPRLMCMTRLNQLDLEKPIKEVGEYDVPVSFGENFGTVKVVVEAE